MAQKDVFEGLNEEQINKVNSLIQQQSLIYKQQAQTYRDQLQLVKTIQTNTYFRPAWPLTSDSILWITLVGILMIPHVILLLFNMHTTPFYWFKMESSYNTSFIVIFSFVYGCFVCSILLYARQRKLEQLLGETQTREQQWQQQYQQTNNKLIKMKEAASKIVVPYALDTLVEMGVNDFMEVGSSKRKMRALPNE